MPQSDSEAVYGMKPSDPALYHKREIAEIARRWDAKAQRWDSDLEDPNCHLNENGAYDRFLHIAEGLCKGRRATCAEGTLLDLGCGTGLVAAHLCRFFRNVVAVDVSSEMLRFGKERGLANVEWLQADAFEGSWVSKRPAAIVSRGVLLSHYGETQGRQLLDLAGSACNDPGFVLVDFLSDNAPSSVLEQTPNKTHFSCCDIRRMADEVGFGKVWFYGRKTDRVRFVALTRG